MADGYHYHTLTQRQEMIKKGRAATTHVRKFQSVIFWGATIMLTAIAALIVLFFVIL